MHLLRTSVLAVVLALWALPVRASSAAAETDSVSASVRSDIERLSPIDLDEVVWLARCIYSESDRPHEQELVAWVVRNRVETRFRGRTYREVVLSSRQFSAFNNPTNRRTHILNLTPDTDLKPWQRALGIALDVYRASPSERPFPQTVRHFYSPVSMPGGRAPQWADEDKQLSSVSLGVNPYRFRFFDNLDEGMSTGPGRSAGGVAEGHPEVSEDDDDDSGFLLPMRPSGRVARPRRPSVRSARNP